ncbi:MAG: ABC transporter ATP-binding protein [Endomicrobia bacterium]|nr:ABC transporter ATP-binding protein [Endomicrobiia bacterium]
MHYTILLNNITKYYKKSFSLKNKVVALDKICLEIPKNTIFTFLGPNGAGKTTLLNIIIGLVNADKGKIYIFDTETTKHIPFYIKSKMNMCSGNPNFPWCMTVKEILNFYCYLYGIAGKKTKQQIEKYLEIFELTKYINRRFDELSTGTKQRLALAKSLLNEPEILLLDEPTLGLDPEVSIKIRTFIQKIHRENNITIILTTHYMKEVDELADYITFINNGKIIAKGTKSEILSLTNTQDLEMAFLKLSHSEYL